MDMCGFHRTQCVKEIKVKHEAELIICFVLQSETSVCMFLSLPPPLSLSLLICCTTTGTVSMATFDHADEGTKTYNRGDFSMSVFYSVVGTSQV